MKTRRLLRLVSCFAILGLVAVACGSGDGATDAGDKASTDDAKDSDSGGAGDADDTTDEVTDAGYTVRHVPADYATIEPVSYIDIPWPDYDFENMPGDPATDPPAPAIDVPMTIDLDTIIAPEPS